MKKPCVHSALAIVALAAPLAFAQQTPSKAMIAATTDCKAVLKAKVITLDFPFSLVFTLWPSRMATLGSDWHPAMLRVFSRRVV